MTLRQVPKSYHALRYVGSGPPRLGETLQKTQWLLLSHRYQDFDPNVTALNPNSLSTGRLEAPLLTVLGKHKEYLG